MARLGRNRYGKSGVQLVKVTRKGDRHELRDLTVTVLLDGDFEAAHVSGDNTRILPTDTMKNTVYALAADKLAGPIEAFGIALGDHFMTAAPIAGARVLISENMWRRIEVGGVAHDHAFTRGSGELRTTRVRRTADSTDVRSGVRNLVLLKTTRSGFVGYIKDKYTTLPETTDRIFATALNAEWRHTAGEVVDYDAEWARAFSALVETFAGHDSLSVQHTLYAMAERALAECPAIASIKLTMPNKHNLLADLSKFGIENRNQIFVATREPYGLIVAEVERS